MFYTVAARCSSLVPRYRPLVTIATLRPTTRGPPSSVTITRFYLYKYEVLVNLMMVLWFFKKTRISNTFSTVR